MNPAETSRISFGVTEVCPEAIEGAVRVLESGWVTSGPEVMAFEEEFAAWTGAEHAIAVSSCTDAIELGLRALDLPPGAKILTSTMTFCGVVNAIVHAGAVPVLVDVSPATLMPDATTTAEAVRRAGGADAMIALHFGGHPAPVEEMAAAAGLPPGRVIEDAAHALGTWVGAKPVGTISPVTCFSFYATKNLPIGEGGMITTADADIADYVRRARLHGMSSDAWRRYMPGGGWRYQVDEPGLKANMSDLQAAIGRAQLSYLAQWQERRAHLAHQYETALSELPGIKTPPWPEGGRHAWNLYVIRVEPEFGTDRDTFIAKLTARGVDCSVHFIPLHHQPYIKRMLGAGIADDFPVADSVFQQIVSLPIYPLLRDEDVTRVCNEIRGLRLAGIEVLLMPELEEHP